MPGVEIESYGDVVYQSHGSTYQYDRYRTGDWRYFGIPDPSAEEVEAVLMTDPASVYTHRTRDADRELTVLTGEEMYWHNPTSVTLKVQARYRAIENTTEISDNEGVFEVRLYREAFDGPWTRFTTVGREVSETGRETLPATEVAEMRTLKDAAAIAEYQAALGTTLGLCSGVAYAAARVCGRAPPQRRARAVEGRPACGIPWGHPLPAPPCAPSSCSAPAPPAP
ncbi:hypothetical protein [Rubrivirga sp. IMCC43871]|uniref:hypothetical protein n=1 Tax=Rubrivirga sp. IMCC43871 TaxID=3391575 RepID=UPI00398FF04C